MVVTVASLPLTIGASECGTGGPTTVPKVGEVVSITPGSAACLDRGAASVGVLYQPDGRDPQGDAWARSVLCVTPEAAAGLTVGGRVQG